MPPEALERMGLILKRYEGRLNSRTEPIREALDPDSAAALGWLVFEGCVASEPKGRDAWGISCLQVLGNEDTADRLGAVVGKLRSHLAVRAITTLAALPTPRALIQLSHIHATDRRAKIKSEAQKALTKAGSTQGLTADQLADRLVPTLGLDPDGTTTLEYGPRCFRVTFDSHLRPIVVDEQGKTRANAPKPSAQDDEAVAMEAYRRWKNLKKASRGIADVQLGRLQNALGSERRWPVEGFRADLVHHPLMGHITRCLLWAGVADDGLVPFRVERSGAFVDSDGSPVAAPAEVVLVHPAALSATEIERWQRAFSGLTQPFRQLQRPCYLPGSAAADEVLSWIRNHSVPGRQVLSLTRRGWRRGGDSPFITLHVDWEVDDLYIVVAMEGGVRRGGLGADEQQNLMVQVVGTPHPVPYSEAILSLFEELVEPNQL